MNIISVLIEEHEFLDIIMHEVNFTYTEIRRFDHFALKLARHIM